MIRMMKKFWSNEQGQDLIEYTLLLAFVALVAAGLFIQAGNSTAGIWGTTSNIVKDGKTKADAAATAAGVQ